MTLPNMQKTQGLSGNALKIIAVTAMLIDHIGAAYIEIELLHRTEPMLLSQVLNTPQGARWLAADNVMRTAGRIAFPIFCFLLVEGLYHTRDIKKYLKRLFVFALISEIPFDLAVFGRIWNPSHQNVYFTLFIGLAVTAGLKKQGEDERFQKRLMGRKMSFRAVSAAVFLAGCGAAWLLRSDYSVEGVLLITAFYLFRGEKKERTWVCGFLSAFESMGNYGAAALAMVPIWFYNGTQGKKRWKYFFYWFYPVHLFLLGLLHL